jgi:hypothetical protein
VEEIEWSCAMSCQNRRERYIVTGVGGRDPVTLDDFVGATTVTVADDARSHRLLGAGLRDDDAVQFHDRELESATEDIKVWTIVQEGDGRMTAEPPTRT